MILLDNSQFMRNGDYIPTRLEAQQDAANLLVGAKTGSHPESTVGVSAGTELLVSPTDDVGKILTALHGLSLGKEADVPASVQVASLALKHRRNKNGSQRIVLFVGSPLDGIDSRVLVKAGKQLKKNNVAIDVVAMGELEENETKLKELVDAANGISDEGERTCHLVTIPPGVLPSDVLASSPIVHGGGAAAAAALSSSAGGDDGGGGAGAFAEFGGIDPNMDPELAMALRVSMEEERARQERVAAEAQEEGKDAEMADASAEAPPPAAPPTAAAAASNLGLTEEEALLQQALAMSMNEDGGEEAAPPAANPDMDDADEDAAMQMALQMSMQAEEEPKEESKTEGQQFQDPQFVNQLLGSLSGVDPNDPAIQNALRNLNEASGEKKEGEDKKDDDKDESG